MVGPTLANPPKEQGNVILSAAASPIQTRTKARRRPKDLESALGPTRPKRPLRQRFTLSMAKRGAAAATGPSVAAKLCGRRGFRPAATLRMTFSGVRQSQSRIVQASVQPTCNKFDEEPTLLPLPYSIARCAASLPRWGRPIRRSSGISTTMIAAAST